MLHNYLETMPTQAPVKGFVAYEHNDISNLDAFADCRTFKSPIKTIGGELIPDYFALVNEEHEPLPARPVSKSYKLVSHLEMYNQQAKQLKESNLPTNNVWVKDTVLDGGLRATREIHFNDLRLDIPLNPSTNARLDVSSGRTVLNDEMGARMDTINSVDMSWAFQAFAGAYRNYCRNTQVFGGEKVYHAKRKHTRNLSPESITENSIVGLDTFSNNRDYFRRMQTIDLNRDEWREIMETTLCRNTSRGAVATTDQSKKVNVALLGQMLYRYDQESAELGSNLWAGYNALTAWSTHVTEDASWIDDDGKDRSRKARTTDANRVPHVQLKRQAKVRDVMNSDAWTAKLAA